MTRYDDRYDEFGYEREDYDGTLELNEYLTGDGAAGDWEEHLLQDGPVRRAAGIQDRKAVAGETGGSVRALLIGYGMLCVSKFAAPLVFVRPIQRLM